MWAAAVEDLEKNRSLESNLYVKKLVFLNSIVFSPISRSTEWKIKDLMANMIFQKYFALVLDLLCFCVSRLKCS